MLYQDAFRVTFLRRIRRSSLFQRDKVGVFDTRAPVGGRGDEKLWIGLCRPDVIKANGDLQIGSSDKEPNRLLQIVGDPELHLPTPYLAVVACAVHSLDHLPADYAVAGLTREPHGQRDWHPLDFNAQNL